jgi:hypothetical protein
MLLYKFTAEMLFNKEAFDAVAALPVQEPDEPVVF